MQNNQFQKRYFQEPMLDQTVNLLFICLIILTSLLFIDTSNSFFGKKCILLFITMVFGGICYLSYHQSVQLLENFQTSFKKQKDNFWVLLNRLPFMHLFISQNHDDKFQQTQYVPRLSETPLQYPQLFTNESQVFQQQILPKQKLSPQIQSINTPIISTKQGTKVRSLVPPQSDDLRYRNQMPWVQTATLQNLQKDNIKPSRKESMLSSTPCNRSLLYQSPNIKMGSHLYGQQSKKNILLQQESSFYMKQQEDEWESKAQETFKQLGIDPFIKKWLNNCEKYIFHKLLPHALSGIYDSIYEANEFLSINHGKHLIEYEIFCRDCNAGVLQTQAISMEDLFQYDQNLSRSQMWPVISTDRIQDLEKIKKNLQIKVMQLKSFEHLFEIPGFRKYEITTYMIERLVQLSGNPQNMEYQQGQRNLKYPTDSQIIAHLFFVFLNQISQKTKDSNLYRNFVLEKNMNVDLKKGDVFFKQINHEAFEPFYIILSGEKEKWFALPGKDNIFCAITLFLFHWKSIMQKEYGQRYLSDYMKEIIQYIIPMPFHY